jgi:pimeloyl-ACP methyl ester carboxylesterase
MITAELDPTQLPPSGMDALVPSLTKHLVRSCGHWTQEEKPDEVNTAIVAKRGRSAAAERVYCLSTRPR